jgi:RNA polymerase sigma-70 factor (ECF subfamily)
MVRSKDQIQDAILLLRAQQGDEQAFGDLVLRWQSRLLRYAHHLTGDHDAAVDVVQETWITVLRKIRSLSDVDAFPAWIYRILTRRAADWIRKRNRRRKHLDRYQPQNTAGPSISPLLGQRIQSLREALGRLSPEHRMAILLYYDQGFHIAEVAHIIGIPLGTVKSRLYAARTQIRNLMENDP